MDCLPGEIRDDVLTGLDGYLFLFGGTHRQMTFMTGEDKPSDASIENFFDNLAKRKNFCDARGIAYIHVVFPPKPLIMKEMIAQPLQSKVEGLFQNHYAASIKYNLPDYLIYPYASLIELKSQKSIFRKFDTHNTDSGYLVVAQQILKKLDANYDANQFFYEKTVELSGDLARMLGLEITESVQILTPIIPPLLFENRSALKGNTNHIRIIYNPLAISDRRLLVFGDSFIFDTLKFLSPEFKDIICVRSDTFQEDMIDLCSPDVVISSNAERYLAKVRSDNHGAPMIFANYGYDGYKPAQDFVDAFKAQFSRRYHREQYESWQTKITSSYFELGDFGRCKLNNHIAIIDNNSFSFKATGNDPYFISFCQKIMPGKKYILELELVSDVSSTASVYFTVQESVLFSEARTVKSAVTIGNNKLHFKLDAPNLQPYIRIDPLSCMGNFNISNLSLTEIITT
ncbi:hypothetical protein [Aeromonas media]|uniref:hypothetical protein n=1 Tax=Aeromonas media TaxID=651 RepID=UPI0002787211|nr:hypothetical protein [Aeromonas media]AHX60275.1 hypothetical protein B224_1395 [Aeromonas media WS]